MVTVIIIISGLIIMARINVIITNSEHVNGNISIAGPQSSLIFYGAYNKSDTTTGTSTRCSII